MTRRRDIDGLRAAAIIPVVLYHADVPFVSGGFVGVDVFFVISGFLISGIIRGELQAGSFSLVNFYERRARRILPALFFVLTASMLAAVIIMRPAPLISFAKSAFAATLFSSNFWFWRTARIGYFDSSSDYLPLLHTWSLAVEEQFYLVFPLFMIALWRFWRGLVPYAIAIGTAISLLLAIAAMTHWQHAAFYLAPLRAWELGVGALLTVFPQPELRARWMRELLALTGLIMILGPIVLFDSSTPFPGLSALPPCLGAAALLTTGARGTNTTSSLLSSSPLVGIGTISYSLYLWHWPILSFLRLRYETTELAPVITALGVGAAFVMATFSWAFVERPFRDGHFLRTKQVFIFSCSAMAASLAASLVIYFGGGFPQRISADALAFADESGDLNPLREECMERYPPSLCELGATNPKREKFLLWGDSYADAIYPGVDQAARTNGVQGLFASMAACPPLLAVGQMDSACRTFNDDMIAFLRTHHDISTVILIARWALYQTGKRPPWGGTPLKPVVLVDSESSRSEEQSNALVFRLGLRRTIDELAALNRRVVIVGDTPEIGWSVPQKLYLQSRWGDPLPPVPSVADIEMRNAEVLANFDSVAKAGKVGVLRLAPILCPYGCPIVYKGRAAYWDDNHFTAFYARDKLSPIFNARIFSGTPEAQPEINSSNGSP